MKNEVTLFASTNYGDISVWYSTIPFRVGVIRWPAFRFFCSEIYNYSIHISLCPLEHYKLYQPTPVMDVIQEYCRIGEELFRPSPEFAPSTLSTEVLLIKQGWLPEPGKPILLEHIGYAGNCYAPERGPNDPEVPQA